MGLFDFGDRAAIRLLAYRIGCTVEDMENEIKKSPNLSTSELHKLSYFIGEEMHKLFLLVRSLSQSSQDSLKVEFKGNKLLFWSFVSELVPINNKVRDLTGYDFLENKVTNKDLFMSLCKKNSIKT